MIITDSRWHDHHLAVDVLALQLMYFGSSQVATIRFVICKVPGHLVQIRRRRSADITERIQYLHTVFKAEVQASKAAMSL